MIGGAYGNSGALWRAFECTGLATVLVMIAVARGWLNAFDEKLLAAARHRQPMRADGKPKRLTTAARDLTALGGDTLRLLFLVCCMSGLTGAGRARAAFALLAIFALARLALFVLKAAVRRPRPDVTGHGIATYTSSFPSGHTFMTVVLFLAAALLIPRGAMDAIVSLGVTLALVISLAIGLTRMSFGIHWPSDVVAGWLAGIAWTSGCVLVVRSFGAPL